MFTVTKVLTSRQMYALRYKSASIVVNIKNVSIAGAMLLALCALILFALSVGKLPLTIAQVIEILITPENAESAFPAKILWDIRLPRVITAVFAGAALGIAGSIFQSISRNPLGSPDIIGFTSGAATGALIQIIYFAGDSIQVALGAIVGGLATAAVVLTLSYQGGTIKRQKMVLTGIGVGAMLSAFNGLLLVKGEIDSAISANLWLAGSLHARTWDHALPVLAGVVLLLPITKLFSAEIVGLELGELRARSIGIRVLKLRLIMTLLGVSLAALATASTGPIAFIALAAPQLALRLRNTANLPFVSSALMGALILLIADLITQLIPSDINLPIGRVCGIIGGFYLLWLLIRAR
ncbi:iron chelate uptake ABC transporter family permease subunit [Vibrio tapetis subsp. quintayensis]|uniref:FecCD family ABC transporter permease n=1 Tax=Vibrio tapetis TaxID=52443 RepID=UPI0025B40A19|nr:iron chelate uptake ABC transporter family permease subunit [Vibrio tapetis]MDN3680882.1 iron chelate uptake ABC transporter family permease subunit [Vibrio tapetis subsp. quintayensis]